MSQIVINDILPRTRLTAILNQTEFNTNWTANAPSDVFVYLTPFGDAPDDAEQKLAYPVDYSVTLVGSQQEVQVILTLPCAAGDIVTIIRQTPADRQNLYSNTNFTPTMLNNDFGILTLVDQQAQMVDQIVGPRYNYSASINTNSPTSTRDSIIPTLGPNQFWGMNDAGDEIVALDISDIGEGVFEIDTGLGLTGGPITSSGTISFAPMAPNTFWGNITGSIAVPTEVPTSYFLKSSDISGSQNSLLYFSSLNVLGTFGPAANSTLVTSAASVPSLSTTLPTTVQSNITQLGVQAIDLNMNNHWIHNLTDPTNPQDAATKAYVLSQTLGAFLPLLGGTMQGAINMGNFQINAMANPTSGQDAVTLSHLSGMLTSYLLKSGGTMTGNINMGSQYITNLLDPVNPQDAATRNYVDTVAIGLTVQASCYAATTTNLTATYANGASGIGATLTNSGALATFTVDGTTPPTNSRILVKNQSSLFQNGIYTLTNVGSGAVAWILTRATDYDQPSEIQPGDLIVINNGTANAGTSFIETDSISVIGTDPIEFSQFTFSATAVLLKANNLFDVADKTISFNNISPLTTKGDLIAYSTQNVRLPVGLTNGQILQVNSATATGLGWSTASYPVTTTVNQILYSNATNTIVGLATTIGGVLVTSNTGTPSMLANPSSTGRMLQSVNGDSPAWSTAIYPSTAGTSGNILTSDGTNWSSSPASSSGTVNAGLINQLAYYPANGSAVSGLATANNAYLVTSATGVPSLTATLGTGLSISGSVLRVGLAQNIPFNSGGGITDSAGLPQLAFTAIPSAVNYFNMSNNAAGGPPSLFVSSLSDTNVDLIFSSKGVGNIAIYNNSGLTPLFVWLATASSVNWIQYSTSTTTNPLLFTATGSDTNIGISLISKGTKGVNIKGTGTNDAAAAGYVGEYIESVLPTASAVTLATGTTKTITSIVLTAGDWDIWGSVVTKPAGGASQTGAAVSVSLVTDTLGISGMSDQPQNYSNVFTGTLQAIKMPTGPGRMLLSATTTVYLTSFVVWTTGTMGAFGFLAARRRR